MAILQGLFLIGMIDCLFYRSIWGMIPLTFAIVPYMKIWLKGQIQKRQREFQLQFKDSLQSLAAALNVGYSVENAMKETKKDLSVMYPKDSRIMQEFTYMIHQLNMNLPLEKVLEEWAQRTEVEEIESFVAVFVTAKRTGGDSISIIRNASHNICDKIDVRREIETMMTAKKLEFKVMIMIPLIILFYMRLSFPEFMEALYGNLMGIILMTICLLVYSVAYMWGRSIVDIEV